MLLFYYYCEYIYCVGHPNGHRGVSQMTPFCGVIEKWGHREVGSSRNKKGEENMIVRDTYLCTRDRVQHIRACHYHDYGNLFQTAFPVSSVVVVSMVIRISSLPLPCSHTTTNSSQKKSSYTFGLDLQ
jgi:hypothetical protein